MKQSTMDFASEELAKYLQILGVKAEIALGLFADFDITLEVEEPLYDDAIAISVKDKKGYVAGSNERSVLIGVYRLLSEWGIGWVRPGRNGTHYPKGCTAPDVEIQEVAAKRHRTVCIEGAVSVENVLDMIEWLPKVGFNGYYIQFSLPYEFFERWYSHRKNTIKSPEPFTVEQAEEYHRRMVQEIKRRGLFLHAMGHGWTCAPFGISDHGWYVQKPESIPQYYKDVCALVNGERKVWRDTPLATQLCYSNPFVRKTMVNAVIKYIDEHRETDVIHFWLGDYFNNTCECSECTKGTHADHYVRMINDITDMLVCRRLDVKVVFCIGYNNAHPPKLERIKHPKNVMLMFAPISRSYAESFPDGYRVTEIPEYKTNGFELVYGKTASVDAHLAYLHAWKQCYDGDIVDFDYHLMWDHILDAGGEGIARVAYNDIRNFDPLGINGFISCQLQRNAFPTSIAMTTMAKALWNNDADFDKIRRELYAAAFGKGALDELCNYFAELSHAFDIGVLRGQRLFDRVEFKERMETVVNVMDSFKAVIEWNLESDNPCHRESWEMLALHRQVYLLIGKAVLARLDYNEEEAGELIKAAQAIVWEHEDELQSVLDSMYFCRMTSERITINKVSEFTAV